MKKHLPAIKKSELFESVRDEDILIMLECLSAHTARFQKGQFIFRTGEVITSAGLVVSGGVCITKEDFFGNRSIITKLGPGHIFGEAYACIPGASLDIGVEAVQDTEVLMLDMQKVLTQCTAACAFHARLIYNLTQTLARKNLVLTSKMGHITKRTLREKILSYLSSQAREHGSADFEIPFDRQQLADYLSADRSALSAELSRMRGDGMIEFSKNRFVLKKESVNQF